MPTTAPYGSWQSPITTDLIVSGAIGLGQVALDGEDIYWAELRPAEGGRMVVVKRTPDGEITDITSEPFSARTRVHEYGGGAYLVHKQVDVEDTVKGFAEILDGKHDEVPESNFYMKGGIAEIQEEK